MRVATVLVLGLIAPAAVAATAAAPALPAALHGQWTARLADCGGEDTSGMTVTATTVTFYEAAGAVRTVARKSDGSVTATLAYTGEGRAWTETDSFRPARDGRTLTVQALGRTFTLTRCP